MDSRLSEVETRNPAHAQPHPVQPSRMGFASEEAEDVEGEPDDDFVADATMPDADAHKDKRGSQRQMPPTGQLTDFRNLQPGPYKCDRINPRTGRPCNSIFSRPYDLDRHNDTIHDSQNQRVRCHLCAVDPFSRKDVLIRHIRVVHPDVDWRGKTKSKKARAHAGISKHGQAKAAMEMSTHGTVP